MLPFTPFILLALASTWSYYNFFITYLTDFEEGKCEMTYMFEYPQFVRIHNKIDKQYEKYSLHSYSEGQLTKKARDMYFDGIPVLFIPGSGGSHKQVRSLASIALRKSLNSRIGYHFNYFTVDLNEELTGLNGALLFEQMNYVNQSIYRVLQLYEKRKDKPTSIVLVGHSMGGVIAKAIVSSLPENSDLIPLVINLASPVVRAPLILDKYFEKFYKQIPATIPKQTTLVSIAGGYNDFLIPAYLTTNASLNLVSTCVPKSWLTVDHLAILWCKQLVLAVNRALFDSVDLKTKQITKDSEYRLQVFKHHLIKNSGTNIRLQDRYNKPLAIDTQGEWVESIYRQYTVRLPKGTRAKRNYMFPLMKESQYESLTLLGVDLKTADWVYVCPAINFLGTGRVCEEGHHLTHLSEIVPSVRGKRRRFNINMHELKANITRATHVIARIVPTDDPVELHVDVYNSQERTILVNNLPKWYTFMSQVVIAETADKAIDYVLVLPDLSHVIHSYKVHVEPMECTKDVHHASVSLSVPWEHQEMHKFVTELSMEPLYMRLHSSKPLDKPDSHASLQLTLDPSCRYTVSVQDTVDFGNIARFYTPFIFANVAAVVLIALASQMKTIAQTGKCSIFCEAINNAKPYYAVAVVRVLAGVLSAKPARRFLLTPDWVLLARDNLDFMLLPLILFLASVGIVWMLTIGLMTGLVLFESTFHKLALKFLTKTFAGSMSLSDYFMNTFQKLPEVVAIILIFLSWSTCGALALWLATGFYFLKLTQMSQDMIEDFVWAIIKNVGRQLKEDIFDRIFNIKPKKNEKRTDSVKAVTETKPLDEQIDEKKAIEENEENAAEESKVVQKTDENTDDKGDEETKDEGDEETKDESNEEIIMGDLNIKLAIKLVKKGKRAEKKTEKEGRFDFYLWFNNLLNTDGIYFHFSIFLIYFVVASLNIQYVFTWAQNFNFNKRLEPDPSFIPGFILSVCALPLWHFDDFPRVDRQYYLNLGHFTCACAVMVLLYAHVSLYRVSYILPAVVVVIVLHQLFAPKKDTIVTITDDNNDEDKNLYEKQIKTKLE